MWEEKDGCWTDGAYHVVKVKSGKFLLSRIKKSGRVNMGIFESLEEAMECSLS